MPVQILLVFALLYVCEKAREYWVPFYLPAIACVGGIYLIKSLLAPFQWAHLEPKTLIIQLLVALGIFYLLDRYENSIGGWLSVFTLGVIALGIVFYNF